MTIAELERAIKSKNRIIISQAKEKAAYDYMLANLIGLNVMRSMSNSIEMPTLQEAYSFLFNDENDKAKEERQQKITELSTLRFKQFAKSYNDRYK